MFYQQGDVKLHKEGSVLDGRSVSFPKDAKKLASLTLAQGTKTGHHHSITKGKATLYDKDGILYLSVEDKQATLNHQEHKPIAIKKGNYEINIVKEYDHFVEEARNVAD